MKTWKQWTLVAILAFIGIIIGFTACDNDNGQTDPKCSCPNGTVHTDAPCSCEAVGFDCNCTYVPICTCPEGTTHEPDEKCCEGTDCECGIAEPSVKNFPNQVMFVDGETEYLADFYDARTACGSKSLDELGIVEQLKSAVSEIYNNAATGLAGAQLKNRFRVVFTPELNTKGKVTITIENGVEYESYEVDDSATLRFNILYLNSVSGTDLQTTINGAVSEMRSKFE